MSSLVYCNELCVIFFISRRERNENEAQEAKENVYELDNDGVSGFTNSMGE